jgi:hypothetical protein
VGDVLVYIRPSTHLQRANVCMQTQKGSSHIKGTPIKARIPTDKGSFVRVNYTHSHLSRFARLDTEGMPQWPRVAASSKSSNTTETCHHHHHHHHGQLLVTPPCPCGGLVNSTKMTYGLQLVGPGLPDWGDGTTGMQRPGCQSGSALALIYGLFQKG